MKKIAILFGNNEYPSHRLVGCEKDATQLSNSLSDLGFECEHHCNTDRQSMSLAFADFEKQLEFFDVALFYFAGHGFEVQNTNYLACIDTSFVDKSNARHTSFPLDDVINALSGSSIKTKIIIIDACRNNPFPDRGSKIGFASVFAPQGTFIAFSTSPGQTATDTPEGGIFTNALLQHINTPNLSIEKLFKRVRNTVSMNTNNEQISWEHTSLMGEFEFHTSRLDGSFANLYSTESFANSNYNGSCKQGEELITDLASGNFSLQNSATSKLTNDLLKTLDKNDIFVIGRQLQYAASPTSYPSWSAESFIENLETRLDSYDDEISHHLLNGMLYEVFFDDVGKIKKEFDYKNYKHFYAVLQNNKFNKSKSFIASQLKNFDQKIYNFPGEYKKYAIDIKLVLSDKLLMLDRIIVDGLDALYNADCTKLINAQSPESHCLLKVEQLEQAICEKLMSRMSDIKFTYSENVAKFTQIGAPLPHDFCLAKYAT